MPPLDRRCILPGATYYNVGVSVVFDLIQEDCLPGAADNAAAGRQTFCPTGFANLSEKIVFLHIDARPFSVADPNQEP
jgi:hypothetical protein